MFDELQKYKNKGHFFFQRDEDLKTNCNAPSDKSGVYIVYALKYGKIELIYIGCSGKKDKNGEIFIRKSGLGGIKDRIVNGLHFARLPRKKSWPIKMLLEDIEALDIYWYVTHNDKFIDCPREVEKKLLFGFLNLNGELPRWNKKM